MNDMDNNNTEVEKKKRGRKPKSAKVNATTSINVNKDTENPDPQILHLNITRKLRQNDLSDTSQLNKIYEKDFCTYDPQMPIPNAYNEHDNFISQPFELCSKTSSTNTFNNIKTIMQNVEQKSLTNVACFWCCHKFENEYLGMPIKYRNGVFEVFGCFCSFECMCAYNFYSNENNNNAWEVYNLINIMSNTLNYDKYVYPAPPRKCLTLFGGYMSIDEFRNFKNSKKIININRTPLVVLVDQIEEVNDFFHSKNKCDNKDSLFNFDKDRINKLEHKINLESKQHIQDNFSSTLDAKMNIT